MSEPSLDSFPPFDLESLLQTVFRPKAGSRVCILVDFEDPATSMTGLAFLNDNRYEIQQNAHKYFYTALQDSVMAKLGLTGGDIYGYGETGGSNLDLPDEAYDSEGKQLSFEGDIYPNYDLILCISTYSATAPLTAFAKQYNFRGATLHGLNDIILRSGLSVDYNQVSATAEALRLGMTKADEIEITFAIDDTPYTMNFNLEQQEAQKSHGICADGPDIANLPAGEIYYVPTKGNGQFPMKYDDGTLALYDVKDCRIVAGKALRGNAETVEKQLALIESDPWVGAIGELGFGTQVLPVSGRDIQDEKVLGTFHIATGRSDHLGGDITPDKFKEKRNASHDDILFAPHKTPEIQAPKVIMRRDGKDIILTENYQASAYMLERLGEAQVNN